MNNINKLFKLDDFIISIEYYTKQATTNIPQSTLNTVRALRGQVNSNQEFYDICLTNLTVHEYLKTNGFLDKDGKLSDFSALVLQSVAESLDYWETLWMFLGNNPLKDKYFPTTTREAIEDNYRSFTEGTSQYYSEYEVHRLKNIHECFYLCCIDTVRDLSMFSKSAQVEGVIEKDLSYKIFVDKDVFLSSIRNYLMYTQGKVNQFGKGKKKAELIVVPILGYDSINVDGTELYIQAIPHIYMDLEAPTGINSFMQLRYRSTEEKEYEISNLQLIYKLSQQLIEQRLCSLTKDAISDVPKSTIDKIDYSIELYHDQTLVVDLGNVGNISNKSMSHDYKSVDATVWNT